MRKYAVFLILTLMLLIVGCQSKDISQNQNTIDRVQADSNTADSTQAKEETTGNSEEISSNTESALDSSNQSSSTESAGNPDRNDDKNTQALSSQPAAKPSAEEKKSDPGSFTLFISKNKGAEEILRKKISILENKPLLDYLRDNTAVKDEGGFIKAIEGLEAITSKDLTSEQKNAGIMGVDWFIFQNNVKTKSGAGDIYPENGDIINLDYSEWTYKDMGP